MFKTSHLRQSTPFSKWQKLVSFWSRYAFLMELQHRKNMLQMWNESKTVTPDSTNHGHAGKYSSIWSEDDSKNRHTLSILNLRGFLNSFSSIGSRFSCWWQGPRDTPLFSVWSVRFWTSGYWPVLEWRKQ